MFLLGLNHKNTATRGCVVPAIGSAYHTPRCFYECGGHQFCDVTLSISDPALVLRMRLISGREVFVYSPPFTT